MRSILRTVLSAVAVSVAIVSVGFGGGTFELLDAMSIPLDWSGRVTPATFLNSVVLNVSGDAQTVLGTFIGENPNNNGTFWDGFAYRDGIFVYLDAFQDGTAPDIGDAASGVFPHDLSYVGEKIVGSRSNADLVSSFPSYPYEAVSWNIDWNQNSVEASLLTAIPAPAKPNTVAADGNVMAGWTGETIGGSDVRAFVTDGNQINYYSPNVQTWQTDYWVQADGRAISDDGRFVVVTESDDELSQYRYVVWDTATQGSDRVINTLYPGFDAGVNGFSGDATTVVMRQDHDGNGTYGGIVYRYNAQSNTYEPITDILNLDPGGVTQDGSMVVGSTQVSPFTGKLEDSAHIWIEGEGLVRLMDYWIDNRMDRSTVCGVLNCNPGLDHIWPLTMSDDGKVFGGFAASFPGAGIGSPTGWVLRLPDGPDVDLDADGDCDIDDLNALLAEGPIAGGVAVVSGTNGRYDLNGDSIIDELDVDQWLAEAAAHNGFSGPYLHGDADLNGVVDFLDFNRWASNRFQSALQWDQGDFNGTGIVDFLDFNIWAANCFQSTPMLVPEPGLTTIFLGLLSMLTCRRRR